MLKRFTRTQTTTACAFALAALGALANANAQSTQTLSTITVQGADDESLPPVAPGGQAATGARLGILGNVDILDAPTSITSYTAELLQDKQARTLAHVMQINTSVSLKHNSRHMIAEWSRAGK